LVRISGDDDGFVCVNNQLAWCFVGVNNQLRISGNDGGFVGVNNQLAWCFVGVNNQLAW
jgi:hypothetical protein